MTTTQHSGATPADCPACARQHLTGIRLRDAKVRKVYGRVSANARKEQARNQREAREIFDATFRAHMSALAAQS